MRKLGLAVLLFVVATLVTAQEVSSPVSGVKHVILIGSDGYGSAYVNWDEVPNLKKMKENGAWTLKTRCVLPSVSAINWASILMGSGSELHGYRTWGSKTPDLPSRVLTDKGRYPCIFSVVHTQLPGAYNACGFSWDGIGYLFENDGTDLKKTDGGNMADTADFALATLPKNPAFAFYYFGEPDETGHAKGWGSPEYMAKVRENDAQVGRILEWLEKNDRMKDTVVIFVSDHGGIEKGHGHETMTDMETPFIVYGCGVKPGEITDVVMNYDTAATIAWLLGLQAPQCWRGKPVTSAFNK